jgi:hypothetical protein
MAAIAWIAIPGENHSRAVWGKRRSYFKSRKAGKGDYGERRWAAPEMGICIKRSQGKHREGRS